VQTFDTKIPVDWPSAAIRTDRCHFERTGAHGRRHQLGGNNEFSVIFSAPDFTTLEGEYSYVLPSADLPSTCATT
jgi:hypothetical protein